jgi:serine O-acetyltransferase
MFDSIREDKKKYRDDKKRRSLQWAQCPGFWITLCYRFGHWGRKLKFPPARLLVRIIHSSAAFPWRMFKSVYLPAQAEIGPGLRMVHPQNIWIPTESVIGKGVSIYHEVTLGTGPLPGVPVIGDNVMIFPGAKILGGVKVGNNVHIGANAVLTKDAPENSTVSGPSARVIPAELAQTVRGIHQQEPHNTPPPAGEE